MCAILVHILMFFCETGCFFMATGQREPSEASFPLPNRLFPQNVFPRECDGERSEDGPWPPRDIGVLVDGGMAHAQATSDLSQGHPLVEMQAYHLSAHRRNKCIDALAEQFNFVFKLLGRSLLRYSVGNEVLLQLGMQLAVTHQVPALVAHA